MVERPHPVRVAVDGRSAAGKSTLGNELEMALEPRGRSVIHTSIDDFYCPWVHKLSRRRLSAEAFYSRAYDYPALRSLLLEPLGPNGSRRYRTRWHDGWNEGQIDEPERIASSDAILIVDGVFLLRPELNGFWDVRVHTSHYHPPHICALRLGRKVGVSGLVRRYHTVLTAGHAWACGAPEAADAGTQAAFSSRSHCNNVWTMLLRGMTCFRGHRGRAEP